MLENSAVFGGGADDKMVTTTEGRRLAAFAEVAARWTIYIALFLFPLFYFPGLSDVIELPKQTLLIITTVVAVLAWLGKTLVSRRLQMRHSVMHVFLAVYVVLYAVSAWFSKNRYLSFVGDVGQEKAGFISLLCFVLLYFVAVNALRDAKDVKRALFWMTLGALVMLVQAVAQALGVQLLPGLVDQNAGFNTIGTTNALGLYAAMAMLLAMGLFLVPSKGERLRVVHTVLKCVLLALGALYVAALQFWVLWLVIIIGALVLVGYGMLKTDRNMQITMLALPMAAIVVGGLFMFIRFPLTLGLPAEVMPSLRASWSISKEALTSQPLLGSGPGTFQFGYTQFRSKELNATNFWSVHFDRSASRLMTLMATTGILGIAAFLVMSLFLLIRTKIKLWRGHEDWLVTLSVYAGWIALFVGKFFYSSNITLEFAFWMLTAMLVTLEWSRRSDTRFEQSPRAALVFSFLFIVALVFSVSGLYLQGQRLVADAHYQRGIAIDVSKPDGTALAAKELLRATQLNGRSDVYFRALSQALALQANQAAAAIGSQMTDEQAQKVTVLAANAVNAGRRATELNPSNVDDWASLAGMYRDLGSAVPGAIDAAMAGYTTASELDPSSPVFKTELAKLHLALADAMLALIAKDTKDATKAELEKKAGEESAKAREQLDKAVSLKPDYAPAHYWIAMLLQREGKAVEALAKLESVRDYNPSDLGVGFQLAILYYQNNKKDAAIAELERIIRLEPQYANARWYLSVMYEEKGNLDAAIAQIQEILKVNPENGDVKTRLEALRAKKAGGGTGTKAGLPEPVDGSQN